VDMPEIIRQFTVDRHELAALSCALVRSGAL